MRNWILAILLFIVPMGVTAQTDPRGGVSWNDPLKGLSEEGKAQIMLEIAKQKSKLTETATADQINEYTEVGKNIAQALIATAGELGKTVDEVLETTTGKLIVALIIWKVAGQELFGIFAAFLWSITLVPVWMYYFHKFCVKYSYEYENDKIIRKNRKDAAPETVSTFIAIAIVIVGIGLIMAFG